MKHGSLGVLQTLETNGIRRSGIKDERLLLDSLCLWYHGCKMMKGGVAGSPLLSKVPKKRFCATRVESQYRLQWRPVYGRMSGVTSGCRYTFKRTAAHLRKQCCGPKSNKLTHRLRLWDLLRHLPRYHRSAILPPFSIQAFDGFGNAFFVDPAFGLLGSDNWPGHWWEVFENVQ